MKKFMALAAHLCIVAFATMALSQASATPEVEYLLESAMMDVSPKVQNSTDLFPATYAEHPHAFLNVIEIIQLHEYKAEVYKVQTDDEYILELHRITGPKNNPNPKGKPVAYLQHGIMSSSADWVLGGPGKGLAFLLADAGYDVWMGNIRGNRYSRLHKRKTIDDPTYWSFGWHEIGVHDLPTIIDFVLKTTEQKKIYYIGHSQGSTTFFVMLSELPDYNDKIHAMFSLAPVAYCSNMHSPIFQFLGKLVKPLSLIYNLLGRYEFKPSSAFFKKFTSKFCQEHSIAQPMCKNALFMITGFDDEQLDKNLLPAIFAHLPAGASVNQVIHYAQIIRSGHFRQFDYGIRGNLAKYRKITPPSYNFTNMKVPVSLHYSVNDWISDSYDVEKLHSRLPNPIGKFRIPHDKFNHLDYLFAKDVKTLLYNKIMSIMSRYKD